MPKQATLDDVFHALANPTRRGVIERLSEGPAPMTELAQPFQMALPSLLQHLQVLESTGIVRSQKQGRSRIFRLRPEALRQAEGWLDAQRTEWEQRLDRLDSLLLQSKDSDQ